MSPTRRKFLRAGAGAAAAFGAGAAAALGLAAGAADITPRTLPAAALVALGKKLAGRLLLPGVPGFTESWIPSNGRFLDTVPLAVARIADAADIATCVAWCRTEGVPFTIRAGGHSYAGLSTTTGIVIDIRDLNAVSLDPGKGQLTVGGAVTNREMLDAVRGGRLTLPGGTCLSVGVGGLTLGGGVGYHTRWAGLTADHLQTTTVVTASGDVVTASASENSDLFWALRGGTGGTFGVNVAMTFGLVEVPPSNVFYRFAWTRGAEDAVAMFRTTDALLRTAPKEFTASGYAQTVPTEPGRPAKDALEISLRGQFNGTEDDFRALVAPILATGPATVTITSQPFWKTAMTFTTEEPENHSWSDYSKYLDAVLPEQVIVDMVDLLANAPARDTASNAQLWMLGWFGGRDGEVGRTDTAYVHRTAKNMVRPSPVWSNLKPELGQELRQWGNELVSILAPHALNESYQNFPNLDIADWPQQYFAENLDRLVEVKTRWDPENIFRSAQSVAPRG